MLSLSIAVKRFAPASSAAFVERNVTRFAVAARIRWSPTSDTVLASLFFPKDKIYKLDFGPITTDSALAVVVSWAGSRRPCLLGHQSDSQIL